MDKNLELKSVDKNLELKPVDKNHELKTAIDELSKAIAENNEKLKKELEGKIVTLKTELDAEAKAKAEADKIKELAELKHKNEEWERKFADMKTLSVMTEQSTRKALNDGKLNFYKSMFRGQIQKAAPTGTVLETQTTNTAGQLGYFIPEEFSAEIVALQAKQGLYRAGGARIMPMISNFLKFAMGTSGLSATRVAEGEEITATNAMCAERITLQLEKIAILTNYTLEFLENITAEGLNVIEQYVANAFATREDYIIGIGDGTEDANNAGVTGILKRTDTEIVTMDSTKDAFTDVSARNLLDMIAAMAYAPMRGAFIIHRTLYGVIASLAVGTTAVTPVYNPATNSIMGYPVIWVNTGFPTLSETAVSTKFIAFGDLEKIIIGESRGIEFRSEYNLAYASEKQLWLKRQDVRVIGQAFVCLKTAAN